MLNNIKKVLEDPDSTWTQQTGSPGAEFTKRGQPVKWKVEGTVDGVDIRVITQPGGQGVVTSIPTNATPNPLP